MRSFRYARASPARGLGTPPCGSPSCHWEAAKSAHAQCPTPDVSGTDSEASDRLSALNPTRES
eukprot:11787576-Alexandrium_andersonii.AAC.1